MEVMASGLALYKVVPAGNPMFAAIEVSKLFEGLDAASGFFK